MKRIIYPTPALANLWKKNFLKDTAKFAKSTHLCPEDYMGTFKDKNGEEWRILGALEGKELPCENLTTGDVFIWDRWEVSLLRRPEDHERTSRKVEVHFPEKKKGRAKKVTETEKETTDSQLSLFSEDSDE